MRWSWPTIEVGCEVSQGAFAEPLLYQNNLPGFGVPAPATAPESLLREHFIWIIMEDDDPMVITITQPLIQPVIDAFSTFSHAAGAPRIGSHPPESLFRGNDYGAPARYFPSALRVRLSFP